MSRKIDFLRIPNSPSDSSAGEDIRRSRSRSKTRVRLDDEAPSNSIITKKAKGDKERKKEKALKKLQKKSEDSSQLQKETLTKDVSVICENISQTVRHIKKEVPDHELVPPPLPFDDVDMTSGPWTEASSKTSKKRRAASPDQVEASSLQEIRDITSAIRGIVLNEGYKVTKWLAEKILNQCSKYEKVLHKMAAENCWLKGKLEATENNKEVLNATCSNLCAQVESISDSLKQQSLDPSPLRSDFEFTSSANKTNRANTSNAPRSYALIVRGDKETLTTDEIKRRMAEGVKDVNVRVRSLRPIRSGGVVVETASGQERELLVNHQSFTEAGLRVVEPRKVRPRVVVYGVPNGLNDDELIKGICEKSLVGLPGMNAPENIKVVKRIPKRDQRSSNVILELPPSCNRKILQDGRVFVGWTSFKTATWEYVPRCYRCLAYGHIAKACDKEQLCLKCCKPGHLAVTCEAPDECGNCRIRKWPSNHAVTSPMCPLYLARLQWLRSRTAQSDNE